MNIIHIENLFSSLTDKHIWDCWNKPEHLVFTRTPAGSTTPCHPSHIFSTLLRSNSSWSYSKENWVESGYVSKWLTKLITNIFQFQTVRLRMKWMAIESTEGYFQDWGTALWLEKWITENNLLIFSAAQQCVHKPPHKKGRQSPCTTLFTTLLKAFPCKHTHGVPLQPLFRITKQRNWI